MHYWKGVLTHAFIISAQPIYYLLRCFFNPSYLKHVSPSWTAFSILIWIYIATRITIPFYKSPLRQLPSPAGERWILAHTKLHKSVPLKYLCDRARSTPNDGLIVYWGPLYLFCSVFPTTTAAVMEMLNTNSYDWEKPAASRRFLAKTLGEGLVNVEGNQHKAMRRAVTPAFSGRHIRDLVPIFYSKGLAFADALAREAKSSPDGALEVGERMSRVTLDIIGAAGIGKDFGTVNNSQDRLAECYHTITTFPKNTPLLLFFLVQSYIPRGMLRLFKGTFHARKAEAEIMLRKEVRMLLREKRQMLQDKPEQQHDIIAIMLRSGDFSDDYLIDQLLTFLAAGHDTTASALTWATYMLATHPDLQDRLHTECDTNLSASGVDATTLDAKNMPYLTAFCNETLRFYPTVPGTERRSVRPSKIGDLVMPKGTHAIFHMWTINRDPTLWGEDADDFNPERWLKGSNAAHGGAVNSAAFMTFLHGPRSCIGQGFAFMEMKCLLAVLATRFRFELAEPDREVEVGGFVTIKPLGGLKLIFHDRKSDADGKS